MPHPTITDSETDCIIGVSFGYRNSDGSISPGLVNQELARFIARNYQRKPLILQWEVDDALQSIAPVKTALRMEKLGNKYLDSHDLLLQAKAFMRANGYRTATLVAHSSHVKRVVAICEKLNIATRVPADLPGVWDKQSDQWWTRSSLLWMLREPAVTLHHRLKRWV